MANILRQTIAVKLSQVTGLSEETLLPLIRPLQVLVKKGYRPALTLPLRHLQQKLSCSKENTLSRTSKTDLENLGNDIANKLTCINHIHNISVEKGHLHFKVSMPGISKNILEAVKREQEGYGFLPKPWQSFKKRKIIVEYSSPNIAKPFHAGHLRSTLIGHFVANLCAVLGHDVIRLNYLGDWGVQFGLLAVGFQRFGSVTELSKDPIQHLFHVYVQINKVAENDPKIMESARKFFTSMEQGDKDSLEIWRRFRQFSIKEYMSIYKRLGVVFDGYHGESQYGAKAQDLLKVLRESGLLEVSDKGTSIINVAEYLKSSPFVTLARSDGSSLYLTRDVAAAIDRHERYGFHRMIYVVDKSQENHMKELVTVLKKMKYSWAEGMLHVKFGRVLGMQTRKGDVVLLKDILEEAKLRMLDRMKSKSTTKEVDDPEAVAECLGFSALILQDLKSTLQYDYEFDWDRILTSHGDTGVSLQYTHARLSSIESNSNIKIMDVDAVSTDGLVEPEAEQLLWHLAQFDEAVFSSYADMEPKHIVSYLLRLSHLASRAIQSLRVEGSERKLAKSRLLLFQSTRRVLSNGMQVLGMKPLYKM